MDSFTIKQDSYKTIYHGTNEEVIKIHDLNDKSKQLIGDAPQKPGYRKNIFDGMSFSMDVCCKDTGIPFESMIRGPIRK